MGMHQRLAYLNILLGLFLLSSCATLPPQSLSPITVPPPLQKISLADVELVSFRLDYSNRPDTWLKVDPFPLRQPEVLARELFEAWSSRFPMIAPLFPAEPNFQPDPGSLIEIVPHNQTHELPGEDPRSPGKATPPQSTTYGLFLLVRLQEDLDSFGNIEQKLEVVIAVVDNQGTKIASKSFDEPLGQSIVDGFVPALLPLESDITDWFSQVFLEVEPEDPTFQRPNYEYRDHSRAAVGNGE
jgi:hypothetical protein